jgi:hypothetical protein
MFRPLPPRAIQEHRHMGEHIPTHNAALCLDEELAASEDSPQKKHVQQ